MSVCFCLDRMMWGLLLNYLIVLHLEVGIYLRPKFLCPIRNTPSIQEGMCMNIVRAHNYCERVLCSLVLNNETVF